MRLLIFALILSLSQTAWAHEMEGLSHSHLENDLGIITPGFDKESDTDRFLAEKVQPCIERMDERSHGAEVAIAHYLRALVEIEMEKLRRGK